MSALPCTIIIVVEYIVDSIGILQNICLVVYFQLSSGMQMVPFGVRELPQRSAYVLVQAVDSLFHLKIFYTCQVDVYLLIAVNESGC